MYAAEVPVLIVLVAENEPFDDLLLEKQHGALLPMWAVVAVIHREEYRNAGVG